MTGVTLKFSAQSADILITRGRTGRPEGKAMEFTVWVLNLGTNKATAVAENVSGEAAEDIARRFRLDHGLTADRIAVLPAWVAGDAWEAPVFQRVAVGPRR